jgi:peptidoglycan hydrolase-like protein with peptidoglycan-binding domain
MSHFAFPPALRLGDIDQLPSFGKPIGELQVALCSLKLPIDKPELQQKKKGASTSKAVLEYKKRVGLPANDDRVTKEMVTFLHADLAHRFVNSSKTRTSKLQQMLLQVRVTVNGQEASLTIDKAEVDSRYFGPSTQQAVKAYQKQLRLAEDGIVSEALFNHLREDCVKARVKSKAGVGRIHRTLMRALNTAKLGNLRISADELKACSIGPTTQAALNAVQTKYKLNVTGKLDAATEDRLLSLAASIPKPVGLLKIGDAQRLKPLKRPARVNMCNDGIADVQAALAFLGFSIHEDEYKSKRFGKSTREAVIAYQRTRTLAVNGHVETATLDSLNREIQRAHPASALTTHPYRVRGSVRDSTWKGKRKVVVEVWERNRALDERKLAERPTNRYGFFDIPYDPPRDETTRQIKQPFGITVKVTEVGRPPLSKRLLNPTQIAWANFTDGEETYPYRGPSLFERRTKALSKVEAGNLMDLCETEAHRQISESAEAAGLQPEDAMRLVLAHRMAAHLRKQPPAVEVLVEMCFAFLAQNQPANMPGNLLGSTNDWKDIDVLLVKHLADELVFMEPAQQEASLTQAIKRNLIPMAVGVRKDAMLASLRKLRGTIVLQQPMLAGGGTLASVFAHAKLAPDVQAAVAEQFLTHQSFGLEFWQALEATPAQYGGDKQIKALKAALEVAHVTQQMGPLITHLEKRMAAGATPTNRPPLKSPRDLAKLSVDQWRNEVIDAGGTVPPGTAGPTPEDKIKNYAETLFRESERLFPTTSFVWQIKGGLGSTSASQDLTYLKEGIEAFSRELETKASDFDLRRDHIPVAPDRLQAAKAGRLLQRVHRLAPTAAAGLALLDKKIHSASQIVAMGKARFVSTMTGDDRLDRRTALTIYGLAEHQYAKVLHRIGEYRLELHGANPRAIISQALTDPDATLRGDGVADLETLFGSMDYCDTPHADSVYGPPAYLTDILRFLGKHDARRDKDDETVLEVLLRRRPDLQQIELTRENTETPLPYIDLVCEVLEAAVPLLENDEGGVLKPPQTTPSVPENQTTRTAAELRAVPEHIRAEAYDVLRKANFPINQAFDLWQEQTRICLDHLGVARWELMEAFQKKDRDDPGASEAKKPMSPSDLSIAGEFWAMSERETNMVVTAKPDELEQRRVWGIPNETAPASDWTVEDFLKRACLDYDSLLKLQQVRWICAADPLVEPDIEILGLGSTYDTKLQLVKGLTLTRLDRLHRFLRLSKHVPWSIWELDILLRSSVVSYPDTVDEAAKGDWLIRLKLLAQVQKRLGLTIEQTLVLFGEISHEVYTKPTTKPTLPGAKLPTYYELLFLNVSAAPDPLAEAAFQAVVAQPQQDQNTFPCLASHRTSVSAAFGLTDVELSQIAVQLNFKPDRHLKRPDLASIGARALLAKGLTLTVKDLLTLVTVGDDDLFKSPKAMFEFTKAVEWISTSGCTFDEIRYWLQAEVESPLALRDETVTQHLVSLRNALSRLPKSTIDSIVGHDVDTPDAKAAKEHARRRMENVIAGQVAAIYSVSSDVAVMLLRNLKIDSRSLSEVLGDEVFIEALAKFKPEIPETHAVQEVGDAIKSGYQAFHSLHKTSLLTKRFKWTNKNLGWLLTKPAAFGIMSPADLPRDIDGAKATFMKWLALVKWTHLLSLYPEPEEASLRTLFDLASTAETDEHVDKVKTTIASLTQWTSDEVDGLIESLGFVIKNKPDDQQQKSDLIRVEAYLKMEKCIGQAKRIGLTPKRTAVWSDRESNGIQQTIAMQARQAVRSKYDPTAWLETVAPLEDKLRDKKREALVAYLVALSQRTCAATIKDPDPATTQRENPAYWREPNDLLRYYLIDVGMSACQLTSRIKQAISTTQMFVQRCLLGLERPEVQLSAGALNEKSSDNAWSQWKWMKSYRIWEANRKVFLYPENWIEPELRDDKSPFFKELEDELMQSDLDDKAAESAFLRYIQKVHEVARLDIVSTYYELHDSTPSDAGSGEDDLLPDVNRLHVIGRTRAQPAIYYYRRYDLNDEEWSAWEKADLDIQSDHVLPVIYNRKLHLFWLTFTEKPQRVDKLPPAKASDTPTDSPQPPNQLEIQLSWSVYNDGSWTPKRVSKEKLIHPWQRPLHTYHLKTRYKKDLNLLWLDIYISQSPEFNSTCFWDANEAKKVFMTSRFPYDAKSRPWHSSSFVFDGAVVEVKMKALAGQYRVPSESDSADQVLSGSNSLSYVRANFGEAGRAIRPLLGSNENAPRVALPDGMHYSTTRLVNNEFATLEGEAAQPGHVNVLEHGRTRTLLTGGKSPFEIVASEHRIDFDTVDFGLVPFFYQDKDKAFVIQPDWRQRINGGKYFLRREVSEVLLQRNASVEWKATKWWFPRYEYVFRAFYHPFTSLFIRELNRSGVDGLLNRTIQLRPETLAPRPLLDFKESYLPTNSARMAKPEQVDFERCGAYALYNWETFFQAPLMLACRLSRNQRFEEAMRWFHFIFDPTNVEGEEVPQRYWVTKPFFEANGEEYRKQRIRDLLSNIEQNEGQLRAWKNNPFKPHLIARYRPVAYQKTVVMKYLDNLIAWGDQLFRRETIETLNEATTLYVLAYEILGRRPTKVPYIRKEPYSYKDIDAAGGLDDFSNLKLPIDIELENYISGSEDAKRRQEGGETPPKLDTFYFEIPNNDQMLGYWDKVEDRLFKIRHCLNLQGKHIQLPLFEPPIDPALLVRAAAVGVDMDNVTSDTSADVGPYRFRTLAQRALDLCGEVRSLGDKLLSALEKSDAEGLAVLRSSQEITLLQVVKDVRKKQAKEAKETLAGLEMSKTLAEQRRDYYGSRNLINDGEGAALAMGGISALLQLKLIAGYSGAAAIALMPRIGTGIAGAMGTPKTDFDPVDGARFAKAAENATAAVASEAALLDKLASMSATLGSYYRRDDDWKFQALVASGELRQIERQIAAAEIRVAIAEKELDNHELQIEHSQGLDDYLRHKYTNQDLYDWQITQVAAIYFQSYQLAFDMAKRAERCFRYELGQDESESFVQFGHWESLRKGLLSGERLSGDIRRLDAAYTERNARELEITKNISLRTYFPGNLAKLLLTGDKCTLTIPEELFDLDYPGHYRRRIKSVAISIPCVTGPHTSLNCMLSLTNSSYRRVDKLRSGSGYSRKDEESLKDARFVDGRVSAGPARIATSHGQNDSGTFELNLSDERFLPFEGEGAVSTWDIELPNDNNVLDKTTVSDVILHIRYTATNSDSKDFVSAAQNAAKAWLPKNGARLFVLDQEFASEWTRFLQSPDETLRFKLTREHLPFYACYWSNAALRGLTLYVQGKPTTQFGCSVVPPDAVDAIAISSGKKKSVTILGKMLLGEWALTITKPDAPDDRPATEDIDHAFLLLEFDTGNLIP